MQSGTEFQLTHLKAKSEPPFHFRPFRCLLSDPCQMSYQNTVAVWENGDMLLGFIQDINGGQALVDFDSKKVEAKWIDTACTYPMPWYKYEHKERNKPVYAALRDEDSGPFRFQLVSIIYPFVACKRCHMCYVKAYTESGDRRIELIDNHQILGVEWFTEPAMVLRNKGLIYTKYVIPFAMADQVISDPADKSRLIKHFRDAFEGEEALTKLTDCCRFHLRIEAGGCIFVVISVGTNADAQQMTITKLSTMLERHLATRADLLPICFENGFPSETNISIADDPIEYPCSEVLFGDLPHFIFGEIFSYLDLHSKMMIRGVCALWHALLSNPRTTKHILVCLDSLNKDIKSDNINCFRAAVLLTRTINAATKSLTIITSSLGEEVIFIIYLLTAMKAVNVYVPLIILKDYVIDTPNLALSDEKFHLEHSAMFEAITFKDRCDRLMLHNWKISYLFGRPMYQIFADDDGFMNLFSLPQREKTLMRPLGWDHALAVDQLEIKLARVVLNCRDGQPQMVSRFMWAVNENFPPVTDEMRAKVKAVYSRWARDLLHPSEWETVRSYLLLFSGFRSDGTPRSWVDVDLVQVDTAELSKMALYGINEVFTADQ
ncbi:uncharacterized protein LOC129590710 isoform X2 [Paramacrobiotus metropolitanus]|nr:uncharacterized protein LOC129590710 isoform X2 [Paramacrobiotus metropolitanus]XP_055342038.1 uncharacterized protein LOC129590710 isoform X2 [Paramacrobiotus metropolitanus]